MTITLTTTGWTGSSNGVWTDGANTVTDNFGGVVNLGITANTLSGKDSITGAGGLDTSNAVLTGLAPLYFGVENLGQIVMGNGQNSITGKATGIVDPTSPYFVSFVFGIYNEGNIAMGNGNNNSITGKAIGDGDALGSPPPSGPGVFPIAGIYNRSGTITMGNGNNNSITGVGIATGGGSYSAGIFNRQGGLIAIGNGNNNSITGVGGFYNGIYNRGTVTIGNGNNNSIHGTGISDAQINGDGVLQGVYGIFNQSTFGNPPTINASPTITIGNGNNASIIGTAIGSLGVGIRNQTASTIALGNGNNDSITGIAEGSHCVGIYNEAGGTIAMGNGSGTINGKAIGNDGFGIHNSGIIDAGGGDDKLFASVNTNCVLQKVTIDGGGTMKMGLGNDIFQGFGNMIVYGDNGTGNISKKDILDLSLFKSSDFIINKIGAGANYAKFTYTDQLLGAVSMTTNEFDKFIFADKTVDYSHLG